MHKGPGLLRALAMTGVGRTLFPVEVDGHFVHQPRENGWFPVTLKLIDNTIGFLPVFDGCDILSDSDKYTLEASPGEACDMRRIGDAIARFLSQIHYEGVVRLNRKRRYRIGAETAKLPGIQSGGYGFVINKVAAGGIYQHRSLFKQLQRFFVYHISRFRRDRQAERHYVAGGVYFLQWQILNAIQAVIPGTGVIAYFTAKRLQHGDQRLPNRAVAYYAYLQPAQFGDPVFEACHFGVDLFSCKYHILVIPELL